MHTVPIDPIGELTPAWRRCIGTGRMNLSLRQDHAAALRLAQQEIGFEMIRGHGMFHDDMGIYRPYQWEGSHRTGYIFTYLDQVIDSYLDLGVRPFLELGFMPAELASGQQTVFWWQGNVTPPRSYAKWKELVQATVRHLINRHGIDEVARWPIEVWNEPNLPHFWENADQRAYFQLYEATAAAVKEVDARLQVGGPVLSPGAEDWWEPFADFIAERSVPIDFISHHAYTSSPAEHVPFGVYQNLRPAQDLLNQFAATRQLLAGSVLAELPVHISEFNTSYRPDNPVHDTAYNAAYLAPVLAAGGDHVDSFAYWTLSDVFEEEGVPASIFHGGFGLLAHGQIRKPTYHLYAFMARMGSAVLARGTDHLVTRKPGGTVAVLTWNPVPSACADARRQLRFSLPMAAEAATSTPRRAFTFRRRVSESDGNAWSTWRDLGRPASPTRQQLDLLHAAAVPAVEHGSVEIVAGRCELNLSLARNEISLIEVTPVRDETPPWLDDTRIPGYGAMK